MGPRTRSLARWPFDAWEGVLGYFRYLPGHGRRLPHRDHVVGLPRFPETLELDLAHGFRQHLVAHAAVDALRHQHLSRRRPGAQARCEIGYGADHTVIEPARE